MRREHTHTFKAKLSSVTLNGNWALNYAVATFAPWHMNKEHAPQCIANSLTERTHKLQQHSHARRIPSKSSYANRIPLSAQHKRETTQTIKPWFIRFNDSDEDYISDSYTAMFPDWPGSKQLKWMKQTTTAGDTKRRTIPWDTQFGVETCQSFKWLSIVGLTYQKISQYCESVYSAAMRKGDVIMFRVAVRKRNTSLVKCLLQQDSELVYAQRKVNQFCRKSCRAI